LRLDASLKGSTRGGSAGDIDAGASRGRRRGATVHVVMKRLGRAIEEMDRPAIEKLQEDNAATPFQTLISTMLSAQTKDRVTHEASLRLFAVASTPARPRRLPERRSSG